MSGISTEMLIIVLLAIINGFFAMSEVALLSARKTRLQHLAEHGSERAQHALDLLQDPNNFLSTIQIGITLVGVLSGAFGGATIAEQIATFVQVHYPPLAGYSESIGITSVVVIITYLSLILGELVPKRLALNQPERIASLVARPMASLSRIGAPLVALLSASTNALLWVFQVRRSDTPAVTEEDVRALIRQGTQTGVFEKGEQQIVDRVFKFADRRVTAIMTVRADIDWIDINDPRATIVEKIRRCNHAKLPVADQDLDHTIGVVIAKDYLTTDKDTDIRHLLRPPLFISEGMPALKVIEQFRKTSMHIALVVDEYGTVQGLVSATDVLEALIGNLPDEEATEEAVVQRPDGSWLVAGSLPIDELKDLLEIESMPQEFAGFQTAAGFIIHHLGRIPKTADSFEFDDVRMEVVDMDGTRIDKILVTSLRRLN